MEFVLQNLILSTEVLREKTGLRYRPNGPVRVSEAGLAFDRGGAATFDTYFNCLRLPEWKYYTQITNAAIRLRFRGHFQITVLSVPNGGSGAPAIRHSCELKSDGAEWKEISFAPDLEEIVYFKLEAVEDSVLLEGCYAGNVENEEMAPAPSLAIVICTHEKEKELLAGLDLLRREIARLRDKSAAIKIIVVDNASSLTQEKVGEDVALYQNNNTGGSGGFTRGILEALDNPAGFTHALLMDDDAEIIPDSLCRSLALIRLAKPGFREARIAGAVVKKESPGIQHVAIEYYGNADWRDFQQNRDLSVFDTSDGVPERHILENGV